MKNVQLRGRTRVVILVTLVVIVFIGSYLRETHSGGYRFIENRIEHSRTLQSQIGPVLRVHLSPFASYHYRTAGSDEWLTISLEVTGALERVTLDIKAKKISGVWQIEQASIEGRPIALD